MPTTHQYVIHKHVFDSNGDLYEFPSLELRTITVPVEVQLTDEQIQAAINVMNEFLNDIVESKQEVK